MTIRKLDEKSAPVGAMLFGRERKLDKVTMVKLLCLMGGNSLRKELYDYPGLKVSASSFSERRTAISPEVLYFALRRFSNTDGGNNWVRCKSFLELLTLITKLSIISLV